MNSIKIYMYYIQKEREVEKKIKRWRERVKKVFFITINLIT